MTREEAIEVIQKLIGRFKSDSRTYKALEMAIQALSQEPCDDAMSREDVFNTIYNMELSNWVKDELWNELKKLPPVTLKLETVTEFADRCRECGARYGKLQKQKLGEWKVVSDVYGDSAYICECSECKDTVWVYKDADRKWNYCPNCGAKMQVESDIKQGLNYADEDTLMSAT